MKSLKKILFLFLTVFSLSFATAAETTVLNSSTVLDWYPTVTVDAAKFSSFAKGDKISLFYENVESSYHQIKLYSGEWYALSTGTLTGAKNEGGSFVPSEKSGTITYTPKSDYEISSIKKTGLRFHGYGLKITKITVSSGATSSVESKPAEPVPAKPTTPTVTSEPKPVIPVAPEKTKEESSVEIYSIGSTGIDLDWSSNITILPEKFSSFGKDNKLQFTYQNNSASYHNIKIYSGKWTSFSSGKVEGAANNAGTFIPSNNSGTILYTPTSTELNALKTTGLLIHGYGVTLKGVSIVGNSTTASSTVSESTTDYLETTTTANPVPVSVSGTPFANHGALHVSGAYLYDSKNQKYQLYGMSTHGINFGNDFSKYVNKDAFKSLRDDWNTNCIRLVLYPRDYNGYCNGGNKDQLKKFITNGIDYATELGMYVIVDWHVHNYNPNETSSEAITFLNEISAKYSKYDNVLYEICNEPTNSNWDSAIKSYAEKVIPVIRKNAPNAIVLVGTNTWSQDIEGPLAKPLSFKNVMYVFHFYASTHRDSYRTRVENAIKAGLPIFITEFGTCDASGNGGFNSAESQKWFDLCAKYNISHMNWSLSNKAETASAIQSGCSKTSSWSYSDLTESGKLIYNHFRSLTR